MHDPCLLQNETSTKQPMVNTPPLGTHIVSICQLKASFNLPFAAQSSAVVWKKEYPSQRAYTTFFTDRRYRQQYRNPPPAPPFRPPDAGRNFISKEFQQYATAMALQMAVKAVNDTAGPDALVPTLLVYETYPRMSNLDPPAPPITDQATVIRKAIAKYSQAIGY